MSEPPLSPIYLVAYAHEDHKPVQEWWSRCTNFVEHDLYRCTRSRACARFKDFTSATRVIRSMKRAGYKVDQIDMFPDLTWPLHPLKFDFARTHLLPSLRQLIRTVYTSSSTQEEEEVTIQFSPSTSTIFLTGSGVTGRTDLLHAHALSLHQSIFVFFNELSLQRVEVTEVRGKHLEVLNRKLAQIVHQRAQRVQTMNLHAVGDETASESKVIVRTTVKDTGVLITVSGILREVRAVMDRIRNCRPKMCPQQKEIVLERGEWERLAHHNTFDRLHAQRTAIERRHAVDFRSNHKQVWVYAITADDLSAGERAFREYVNGLTR